MLSFNRSSVDSEKKEKVSMSTDDFNSILKNYSDVSFRMVSNDGVVALEPADRDTEKYIMGKMLSEYGSDIIDSEGDESRLLASVVDVCFKGTEFDGGIFKAVTCQSREFIDLPIGRVFANIYDSPDQQESKLEYLNDILGINSEKFLSGTLFKRDVIALTYDGLNGFVIIDTSDNPVSKIEDLKVRSLVKSSVLSSVAHGQRSDPFGGDEFFSCSEFNIVSDNNMANLITDNINSQILPERENPDKLGVFGGVVAGRGMLCLSTVMLSNLFADNEIELKYSSPALNLENGSVDKLVSIDKSFSSIFCDKSGEVIIRENGKKWGLKNGDYFKINRVFPYDRVSPKVNAFEYEFSSDQVNKAANNLDIPF